MKKLLLITVITMTGCSSYIYAPEVKNFSEGVNTLAADYTNSKQVLTDLTVAQRYHADAKYRLRLALLGGCDNIVKSENSSTFADCDIVSFGQTIKPPETTIEIRIKNAGIAFDALKKYVTELSAVTAASDDTALSLATKNLATSAVGLSSFAAELVPGTSITATNATAATGILDQAVNIYLDHRKLEALRIYVPSSDDYVKILANYTLVTLLDIRAHQLLQAQKDMREAAESLESVNDIGSMSIAEYRDALSNLAIKVNTFNTIRNADPHETIAAMIDAHHKLSVALTNDTGQDEIVLTATLNFLKTASQLQIISLTTTSSKSK